MKHTSRLFNLLNRWKSNEDFSSLEKSILTKQKANLDEQLLNLRKELVNVDIYCELLNIEDLTMVGQFVSFLYELRETLKEAFIDNTNLTLLLNDPKIQSFQDQGTFVIYSDVQIRLIIDLIKTLPKSKKFYVSQDIKNSPLRIFEKTTAVDFSQLSTHLMKQETLEALQHSIRHQTRNKEFDYQQNINQLLKGNKTYAISAEHLEFHLTRFSRTIEHRSSQNQFFRRLVYWFMSFSIYLISATFLFGLCMLFFNPFSINYDRSGLIDGWNFFAQVILMPLFVIGLQVIQSIVTFMFRVRRIINIHWAEMIAPVGFAQILSLIYTVIAFTRPAVDTNNYIYLTVYAVLIIIASTFETLLTWVGKRRYLPRVNHEHENTILWIHFQQFTENGLSLLTVGIIPMSLFASRLDGITYAWVSSIVMVFTVLIEIFKFSAYTNEPSIQELFRRQNRE